MASLFWNMFQRLMGRMKTCLFKLGLSLVSLRIEPMLNDFGKGNLAFIGSFFIYPTAGGFLGSQNSRRSHLIRSYLVGILKCLKKLIGYWSNR